jgi:hypothetical protein
MKSDPEKLFCHEQYFIAACHSPGGCPRGTLYMMQMQILSVACHQGLPKH